MEGGRRMKTVAFNKPRTLDAHSADRWVVTPDVGITPEQAPRQAVPMKRFTIDVPADLHRRIKTSCATEGTKMADMLREILETRFPAKS
jgi:hypothetical protein